MFSKPLAVGLLALACVTAAAGGAYVAVRSTSAVAGVSCGPGAAASHTQPRPPAVQDTEAVVSAPPAPAALEKARPAPVPAPALRRSQPGGVHAGPARPGRPRHRRPTPRRPSPAGGAAPNSQPRGCQRPADRARREQSPGAATRTGSPARPEPVAAPAPRAPGTPPTPPTPELVELEVPAASVIGLQIETPVSTERARVEDRVEARVMRDVTVDGRTAIPAGTRAIGAVTLVERGGKVKERARLGVRFHTLVLADGTQLPIRTDPIIREGESPGRRQRPQDRRRGGRRRDPRRASSAARRARSIGGATGAAGGTAVVMAGDRNAATLASGAVVTVRLSAPVQVEVEKK